MKKLFVLTWIGLFNLIVCVSAQAVIIHLVAELDGLQANAGAGTGSAGTGSAQITLDDVTNELIWEVQWSELTGSVTAAHFHGPAAIDENAGVQVAIDTASNPSSGSAFLNDDQESNLLDGLWYINIHSSFVQSGEIRGQVTPAEIPLPASAWLLVSALVGLTGIASRRSA